MSTCARAPATLRYGNGGCENLKLLKPGRGAERPNLEAARRVQVGGSGRGARLAVERVGVGELVGHDQDVLEVLNGLVGLRAAARMSGSAMPGARAGRERKDLLLVVAREEAEARRDPRRRERYVHLPRAARSQPRLGRVSLESQRGLTRGSTAAQTLDLGPCAPRIHFRSLHCPATCLASHSGRGRTCVPSASAALRRCRCRNFCVLTCRSWNGTEKRTWAARGPRSRTLAPERACEAAAAAAAAVAAPHARDPEVPSARRALPRAPGGQTSRPR
jgi:hypothetical protein